MSYDWTDYWWLLLVFGFFLIPELVAKFDKRFEGTKSEWIWRIWALKKRNQRYKFLRRWSFSAFWVGLSLHFLFTTSVWPVIIYGAPAAFWIWYSMKYETKTGRRRPKRKKK
ncbi:MAG: hypothetical protein GY906_24825 [bacterium]|nr:hypothetical protein [bacterium]